MTRRMARWVATVAGAAMAVVLMVVTLIVLLIASRFVKLRDVYGALGED